MTHVESISTLLIFSSPYQPWEHRLISMLHPHLHFSIRAMTCQFHAFKLLNCDSATCPYIKLPVWLLT
jgi:hypothetical protein